jgi:aminomethyltransferase
LAAAVLRSCVDVNIDALKYFRATTARIDGIGVDVSRTGYTGDLGYELWVPGGQAVAVWDALMRAGRPFGLKPTGMLALDVARVEAGLLLIDVDFVGSRKAMTADQRSTPDELGLGRLVRLDKAPFVGRSAIIAERERGVGRRVVGIEVEWTDVEARYERAGLAPVAPAAASRAAVPVRKSGRQIGRATTTTWSPVLKKLIALATIESAYADAGTALEFEITIEGVRHFVGARVVRTPFFNPVRKTATPPM